MRNGPKARARRIDQSIHAGISTARNRVIDATIHWEHDMLWLLERMFSVDTLEACKRGYNACSYTHRLGSTSYRVDTSCMLFWSGATFNMLAPCLETGSLMPDQLNHFVAEVRNQVYKFAKVSHVYNWFTMQKVNLATMREYCPWLMSLVKHELHGEFTGRVTEPNGIGPMLPLIREVAVIMATAFLVPNQQPKAKKLQFSLQFDGYYVDRISVSPFTLEL
jgi:hypothetical protein